MPLLPLCFREFGPHGFRAGGVLPREQVERADVPGGRPQVAGAVAVLRTRGFEVRHERQCRGHLPLREEEVGPHRVDERGAQVVGFAEPGQHVGRLLQRVAGGGGVALFLVDERDVQPQVEPHRVRGPADGFAQCEAAAELRHRLREVAAPRRRHAGEVVALGPHRVRGKLVLAVQLGAPDEQRVGLVRRVAREFGGGEVHQHLRHRPQVRRVGRVEVGERQQQRLPRGRVRGGHQLQAAAVGLQPAVHERVAGPPLARGEGHVERQPELLRRPRERLKANERGERPAGVGVVGRGVDGGAVLGRGLVAELRRLRAPDGGDRPLREDVARDEPALRLVLAVQVERRLEERRGLGILPLRGEEFRALALRVAAAEWVFELVVKVREFGQCGECAGGVAAPEARLREVAAGGDAGRAVAGPLGFLRLFRGGLLQFRPPRTLGRVLPLKRDLRAQAERLQPTCPRERRVRGQRRGEVRVGVVGVAEFEEALAGEEVERGQPGGVAHVREPRAVRLREADRLVGAPGADVEVHQSVERLPLQEPVVGAEGGFVQRLRLAEPVGGVQALGLLKRLGGRVGRGRQREHEDERRREHRVPLASSRLPCGAGVPPAPNASRRDARTTRRAPVTWRGTGVRPRTSRLARPLRPS